MLLASGALVSRMLGFIRTVLLAAAIGQSASGAAVAFGLAGALPNMIYLLVASGVVTAVFAPQILRAGRTADGGNAYINRLITLGGTIFLVVTVVATLAAPWITRAFAIESDDGSGYSGATMALAVSFAYWCMPQIFFYAMYALLGEIFNARGHFGPYTWAPALNNIVACAGLIAFMALFGGAEANRAVDAWTPDKIALLGGVWTAAIALQALVLVVLLGRTGIRFRPDFRWRGVGLGTTGRRAGWLFGLVAVNQLTGWYQLFVGSLAGTDATTIATLQNAWFVFLLPHSVIAVSIVIAFFTTMTHHANDGDVQALRTDLSGALRAVGMLTVFCAVAIGVIALPFASLYEAEFGHRLGMALLLWVLLAGLVPFSAEYTVQRVFYALDDTKTPFVVGALMGAVSIAAMSVAWSLPAEWVIVGIAGAIALTYLVSALVWLVLVRRRIGAFGFRLVALRHLRYAGMALLAAVPGVLICWVSGAYTPDGWAQQSVGAAVLSCVVSGVAMGAAYLGLLWLGRDPDFARVVAVVRRAVRRDGADAHLIDTGSIALASTSAPVPVISAEGPGPAERHSNDEDAPSERG